MAVMPTKIPQRQRRYRQIASISFKGKLNYNMLGRGIYVCNFSNLSFQLLHVFLVDACSINLKLEILLYFRTVLQLPHHCCKITPDWKFFFADQNNAIRPGIPRAPEI